MKRFLTTTALVAAMAAPVYAQDANSETSGQSQDMAASNEFDRSQIMATSLIDMRLYMPRQGGMEDGSQAADSQQNMDAEGGSDTEMAESDNSMDTEGSDMEMADSEQSMEGEGTDAEMAEADDVDGPVENELEEAGNEVADAANDAGQAIENTAEDAGQELAEAAEATEQAAENAGQEVAEAANETEQAVENAGSELAGEFTEAPDSWEMVGEIEDLVVTQEGEVVALIVDAGGFLGIGETEKRVDLENVRFITDADDEGEFFVVFTGDRTTFEEQESYDQAAAEEAGEMRASETDQMAEANEQRQMENEQAEAIDWASVTTEDVLGSAVYGKNDEWVGDLSEFAMAEDGKIESVIIDVGGFLGLGEKPVSLPLDQIELRQVRGDEVRAYVNASEEELESMETWTGSDM